MASTSGTVTATPFTLRSVIEHAARRGPKLLPQALTAEDLKTAQESVYTLTAQWINAGFPLWTQYKTMLGVRLGSPNVSVPTGVLDVVLPMWRLLNPWRGAATTTGGANASTLFAGAPCDDVTITGPNAGVTAAFGTDTEVDTIGVLLGGSTGFTAALEVLTSDDGSSFTVAQTLPTATYVPGEWSYVDLDPVVTAPFVQLRRAGAGTLVLNQLNFGLANWTEIPLGRLNRDDYFNLPDVLYSSNQPNSAFVDRQFPLPIIRVWPIPNTQAFYNGTVTAVVRRYIQDPGALTNDVEVPARWLEALIWRLAHTLMYELPPADDKNPQNLFTSQQLLAREQRVDQQATKAEMLAWAEERDKSPIRLVANISAYTR